MSDSIIEKFNRLKRQFEGQLAIYREKGFWLVRVNNIQLDLEWQKIEAIALCSPLTGHRRCPRPFWTFSGGYLTEFSRYIWLMGYGGWTLFFEPEFISRAVSLVEKMPSTADSWDRHLELSKYANDLLLSTTYHRERVFPDPPPRNIT